MRTELMVNLNFPPKSFLKKTDYRENNHPFLKIYRAQKPTQNQKQPKNNQKKPQLRNMFHPFANMSEMNDSVGSLDPFKTIFSDSERLKMLFGHLLVHFIYNDPLSVGRVTRSHGDSLLYVPPANFKTGKRSDDLMLAAGREILLHQLPSWRSLEGRSSSTTRGKQPNEPLFIEGEVILFRFLLSIFKPISGSFSSSSFVFY